MAANKDNIVYRGPGLGVLLTVLFVGLKLTGHIAWSWWWVLSPLWIPFAFVFGIAGIILLGAGILWLTVALIEWVTSDKEKPPRKNKARGL